MIGIGGFISVFGFGYFRAGAGISVSGCMASRKRRQGRMGLDVELSATFLHVNAAACAHSHIIRSCCFGSPRRVLHMLL